LVVFHRETFKAVLENVADVVIFPCEVFGVKQKEPLWDFTERLLDRKLNQKVDMVGHEAVVVDIKVEAPFEKTKEEEKTFIIFRFSEESLAVIAAGNDVIGNIG